MRRRTAVPSGTKIKEAAFTKNAPLPVKSVPAVPALMTGNMILLNLDVSIDLYMPPEDFVPVCDQTSMIAPIFSLCDENSGSKGGTDAKNKKGSKKTQPYVFTDADGTRRSIKILAGEDGLPRIQDQDLIIYVLSGIKYLRDVLHVELDMNVSVPILFLPSNYFKLTGRTNTNGREYLKLKKALSRIGDVRIETNVPTGRTRENPEGDTQWSKFPYISGAGYLQRNKDKKLKQVAILLSPWLWKAAVGGKELLTLDPRYWTLTPTEQALYKIARRFVGTRDGWHTVQLKDLQIQVGSKGRLDKFRTRILKAINRCKVNKGELPLLGYKMRYCDITNSVTFVHADGETPKVTSRRRQKKISHVQDPPF